MNLIFPIILTITATLGFRQDKWQVPDSELTRANPTDIHDKDNLAIGKSLFMQNCKTCHGKEGHGDGAQAKRLEIDMIDFSQATFKEQTDGALFYKISTGRGLMPEFSKKLEEEDRWLLINYLRTLE